MDGSLISGTTDFFPNSFGVGFVPNVQDLYNANELNPPGGAGRSMFNLETVVESIIGISKGEFSINEKQKNMILNCLLKLCSCLINKYNKKIERP